MRKLSWLTLLLSGVTQPVWADSTDVFEVMHINYNDGYVVISGGSKHGLADGDQICIFREDNDEEPVGCGPLTKVRTTVAVVLIGRKAVKNVEIGMLTQPSSAISSFREKTSELPAVGEDEKALNTDDESDVGDFGSEQDKKPEVVKRAKMAKVKAKEKARAAKEPLKATTRGFFELEVDTMVLAPFSVNIPTFNVQARYQQSGSLWKKDKAVRKIPGIIGFGLGLPLTGETIGRIKMSYALIPNDKLDADIDPTSEQVFFRGQFATRSYNVGFEILNPIVTWSLGGIEWFGGLGVTRTELDFSGTQFDDRDGTKRDIVRYSAVLVTTDVHAGATLFWRRKSWFTGLTLNMGIPAFSLKTKRFFNHDLPDDIDQTQKDASQKDLESTIDFKQAPVSLQIGLVSRYFW